MKLSNFSGVQKTKPSITVKEAPVIGNRVYTNLIFPPPPWTKRIRRWKIIGWNLWLPA
jgi:hypothetical protein